MTPEEIDAGIATVRDWLDEYPETTVVRLFEARAWEVKGYPDWDALCAGEFPRKVQLPRPERRELVATLADAGMSTRAIAAAVGVSKDTVSRDLAGVSDETPEPAPVQGLDGKKYPRPAKPADDVPRSPAPEIQQTEQALADWVQASPDVRRANIRRDFTKWMHDIWAAHLFDPAELADICPDSEADVIQTMNRFTQWHDDYRAALRRTRKEFMKGAAE